MLAKSGARQGNSRRFMQALMIGVAGCALSTGSAYAQACPAAVAGTITVASGVTCGPLSLSGRTNLVVDFGGKITNSAQSTVSGGPQGDITINGEVSQTGTQNAIAHNPGTSVGNITIGAIGRVSAGVTAIDYRNVSTSLGSFTNYGVVTGSGAFSTSVATVGGDIANYGSLNGVTSGIFTQNQRINGNILNAANATITMTGTGNNNSGIRLFSNVVLNGDLLNAGTISGVASSVTNVFTSGIMTAGPSSSISRSLTNSGTISGYNIGVNLANTNVVGGLTNSGNITDVVDRGISVFGGTFGSFLNSNRITAKGVGSYGVISTNATYSGAFTNSGTINAVEKGVSISGGTFGSLLNSGTITATSISSNGIVSANATYNGSFVNSGAITSVGGAMSLTGDTVRGDISNTATGTLTSTGGVNSGVGLSINTVTLTGSLTNAGRIVGSGTGGVAGVSASGSSIGGNLVNSGEISGFMGSGSPISARWALSPMRVRSPRAIRRCSPRRERSMAMC